MIFFLKNFAEFWNLNFPENTEILIEDWIILYLEAFDAAEMIESIDELVTEQNLIEDLIFVLYRIGMVVDVPVNDDDNANTTLKKTPLRIWPA